MVRYHPRLRKEEGFVRDETSPPPSQQARVPHETEKLLPASREPGGREARGQTTNLQECALFLRLEFFGSENAKTTRSLLIGETSLRAVEKFEHIVNYEGFQISLLLSYRSPALSSNLYYCPATIKEGVT